MLELMFLLQSESDIFNLMLLHILKHAFKPVGIQSFYDGFEVLLEFGSLLVLRAIFECLHQKDQQTRSKTFFLFSLFLI